MKTRLELKVLDRQQQPGAYKLVFTSQLSVFFLFFILQRFWSFSELPPFSLFLSFSGLSQSFFLTLIPPLHTFLCILKTLKQHSEIDLLLKTRWIELGIAARSYLQSGWLGLRGMNFQSGRRKLSSLQRGKYPDGMPNKKMLLSFSPPLFHFSLSLQHASIFFLGIEGKQINILGVATK